MEEEGQKEVVGYEPLSFALLQGDSLCLSGRSGRYTRLHSSCTRPHRCCTTIHSHYTRLRSSCILFNGSLIPHLAVCNAIRLLHHHSDFSATQSNHSPPLKPHQPLVNQRTLSPPTPQPLIASSALETTFDPLSRQSLNTPSSEGNDGKSQEDELPQDRCMPFFKRDTETRQEDKPLHTPHQGGDAISPAFASITSGGRALLPSITHGGHRPLYTQKNKEDSHEPF